MPILKKIGDIQLLAEKKGLLRILFLIFLPIMLYIDFSTIKPVHSFYILIMIFIGFSFNHVGLQLLFSGIMAFFRFYFHNATVPDWDTFFYQWAAFFCISFVIMTLFRKYINQRANIAQLTTVLAKALDSRDSYTANHSENVANYSKMIAEEMGFTQKEIEDIYHGGLLHDIGKIGVPESVLTKPSRLTNEEFNEIKKHPEIGYRILKNVPYLEKQGVLDIVLYHHERADGKGYPKGLKGKEIPLKARIVAVSDAFDAMTTKRVYRNNPGIDYAINEIKKNKGIQFDEEVVDAFLKVIVKQNLKF